MDKKYFDDIYQKALSYVHKIGTEFTDRDMIETAREGNSHEAMILWIVEELRSAGYSDSRITRQDFTETYDDHEFTGTNVILSVPGKNSTKQIIIGAHHDGDGIGDNGTGAALLLAAACTLSSFEPEYDLKFIFFDGEEYGLYGSKYYSSNMTEEEVASTLYMINMDALAFGDYCNIYGGNCDDENNTFLTEAYELAMDRAETLGFKTWRTGDLDGYFNQHGTGPAVEPDTFYSNPWTKENPSPSNFKVPSPMTIFASDHAGFLRRGIQIVYFEATNWFVKGDVEKWEYIGYYETYRDDVGDHGMFMNTEYDTLENLITYFPGRLESHLRQFGTLLISLITEPLPL
ncbi:MAG: M28 family peptidase [Clostridia bacterium]|nr:M28 family peptidase [Clostridia bacterium]